jgi:hypothetical protein
VVATTLALLALVLASGCGSRHASSDSGSLEIVGGNSAQRQLVRRTALLVGSHEIQRVVFEEPPPVYARRTDGMAMSLVSSPAHRLRAAWDEDLFVATYRGLAKPGSDAAIAWAGSSNRRPFVRMRPAAADPALVNLATAIRGRARADHAEIAELSTPTTLLPAIALTLRVSDPVKFVRSRADWYLQQLWGLQPAMRATAKDAAGRFAIVGTYFAVEGPTGEVVIELGSMPGHGSRYVSLKYAACFGGSSGLIYRGRVPARPPCPE